MGKRFLKSSSLQLIAWSNVLEQLEQSTCRRGIASGVEDTLDFDWKSWKETVDERTVILLMTVTFGSLDFVTVVDVCGEEA